MIFKNECTLKVWQKYSTRLSVGLTQGGVDEKVLEREI